MHRAQPSRVAAATARIIVGVVHVNIAGPVQAGPLPARRASSTYIKS
jgi:hypothetical protein